MKQVSSKATKSRAAEGKNSPVAKAAKVRVQQNAEVQPGPEATGKAQGRPKNPKR